MPGAQIPVDVVGGLVTHLEEQALPNGVSPECYDLEFGGGYAITRGGLQVFSNPSKGYTVQYEEEFIDSQNNTWLLSFGGNVLTCMNRNTNLPLQFGGNGTLTPGTLPQSCSAFDREYIAFGDGRYGVDYPRQFDGTYLDRVTQWGPGLGPTAQSYLPPSVNISTSAGSLVRSKGIVTVVTAAPHGFQPGWSIQNATVIPTSANIAITGIVANGDGTITVSLASAGNYQINTIVIISGIGYTPSTDPIPPQGYYTVINCPTVNSFTIAYDVIPSTDWTFTYAYAVVPWFTNTAPSPGEISYPILSIPSATSFTYAQPGPDYTQPTVDLPDSTIFVVGQIAQGLHQVSVAYITRQGYITCPSVPLSFYAVGSQLVELTNIPLGPLNTVSRLLMFTPVIQPGQLQGSFYSIDATVPGATTMLIQDNTTTSLIVDFSESDLLAAESEDYLFGQVVLGECAGVSAFSDRLFWTGERNCMQQWINLDFWGGVASNGYPLGWTKDATYGAGGIVVEYAEQPEVIYTITADGVTVNRGMITQPAFQDYLQVPIIEPNVPYSARVRAMSPTDNPLTAGALSVELYSPTMGSLGIADFAAATLVGTEYIEVSGAITNSSGIAVVPSDIKLRVYLSGTPKPAGGYVNIWALEIFETQQPYNSRLVRASYVEGGNGQESYDSETGILEPSPASQDVRCCYTGLGEFFEIVRTGSVFQTSDNGQEPVDWVLDQVANVGTLSSHGAGVSAEQWSVIASPLGLYFFPGQNPVRISTEIQYNASGVSYDDGGTPNWNDINWEYGHTIWIVVDDANGRLYAGVPMGSTATGPNMIFMLDYNQMPSSAALAEAMSYHYSAYTAKPIVRGDSRKYCPWRISAPCACIFTDQNNKTYALFGDSTTGGNIFALTEGVYNDNGAVINSYYRTARIPDRQEEQVFQLGSAIHRIAKISWLLDCSQGDIPLRAWMPRKVGKPLPVTRVPGKTALNNPSNQSFQFDMNNEAEGFTIDAETHLLNQWMRFGRIVSWVEESPSAPTTMTR